ncbi:MAG: hypothetical protein IJT91_06035 [Clostridia bacterium]|nr:hypothetical protein [Clostridia bacterium]
MKRNCFIKYSVLLILVLTLGLLSSVIAFADGGNVSYNGQSEKFVFAPGSEFSPTDLFTEFKDVLPGDVLTDHILVKNTTDKENVKIYMRSLGADEDSKDFLSQLTLVVKTSDSELFNETSDKPAQLTDWVLLGSFKPGEEVTLDLELTVPDDLDIKYHSTVGKLVWEFKVEEIPEETTTTTAPAETTTAKPAATTAKPSTTPKTGDVMNTNTYVIVFILSGIAIITTIAVIVYNSRRKKKHD